MPDSFDPADDLSPALGGARAIPDDPLPPPPVEEPPPRPEFAMPEMEALRAELEEVFGTDTPELIEALGQVGALGAGLAQLFTSTIETLETRLPQTISAFEGLFDALGQAAEEALEPLFTPDENA